MGWNVCYVFVFFLNGGNEYGEDEMKWLFLKIEGRVGNMWECVVRYFLLKMLGKIGLNEFEKNLENF